MTKSKLSKSVRKFIRMEKSRIRKEVFGLEKQEEMIMDLYKRFLSDKKINNTKLEKSDKSSKTEDIKIENNGKSKIKKQKEKSKKRPMSGKKKKS